MASRRREAGTTDEGPFIDPHAGVDREPAEIPIEGERLIAVIDDDQGAESFERTCEGDFATMDGIDGVAWLLGSGSWRAVSGGGRYTDEPRHPERRQQRQER